MVKLNVILSLVYLFLVGFICNNINGQSTDSPILFIYDASGSMWGKLNDQFKKDIASEVLTNTIDQLGTNQKVGLIAYGHRSKSDCQDVELLVEIENTNKSKLKSAIKSINPLGKTPLAYSVEKAIEQIEVSGTKTTIILVTDGIESCQGNICEAIKLAKQAGLEFKLHIVGFGLKEEELASLKCATHEGGGNYYDAKNANQLAKSISLAVNEKVDDPIPNHSFFVTKNGIPVDAWIKINEKDSGIELRGVRTYQDTAKMFLPSGDYNLTINPLEGTDITSKTLSLTKTSGSPAHNTISFDGGNFNILISNNGENWDATIKVYQKDSKTIIASGRTYGKIKSIEVDQGIYDIEVLPLNVKGNELSFQFQGIEVHPKETIDLNHDYKTGKLSVGVMLKSGELVDAVVKINEQGGKNVAGMRTYTSDSSNPKTITILPGTYEINISTLGLHKGTSKSEFISVTQGEMSTKIFKLD